VKSRDGRDLKIQVADNVTVAVAKSIRFEDIKAGDYVGATTKPGPDGTAIAIEVHYLAPTTPEGQSAWDLQPGSTMTHANVGLDRNGDGQAGDHAATQVGDAKIVPDDAALVRRSLGRAPISSPANTSSSARRLPRTARFPPRESRSQGRRKRCRSDEHPVRHLPR
jgi:hypothetical protein